MTICSPNARPLTTIRRSMSVRSMGLVPTVFLMRADGLGSMYRMKPAARRVFQLVTTAFFLASAILWGCSYFATCAVWHVTSGPTTKLQDGASSHSNDNVVSTWMAESCHGRIDLIAVRETGETDETGWDFSVTRHVTSEGATGRWYALGFAYDNAVGKGLLGPEGSGLRIPWWFLTLCFGIPVAVWIMKRRRAGHGFPIRADTTRDLLP
jgi:hypothetical protein